MITSKRRLSQLGILLLCITSLAISGCSSKPYKKQKYAKLSNTKVFENEMEVVWKGVLSALEEYKIKEKDRSDGKVVTDWIYSTSTEKYIEYKVNNFPRKHYLQTRYKFDIKIEHHIGGVRVTVGAIEEVEALKDDGTFDDWEEAEEPDYSRAHEMLKSIELKILSRPNL